jgi:hypothetical protein
MLYGNFRQQIFVFNIGEKCRTLAYNPDGSHIAVGTAEGEVFVLANNDQTGPLLFRRFTISTQVMKW